MNSEELELSLRTEFESYLKTHRAEMRREAKEFQDRIESEFEKQKTQFDEAFQAFSARFEAEPEFDEGFRGSVAEHLRIARDEGARIAATANDEAVKMAQEAAPAPKYDEIRDAIKDISIKESQSAILKSLVSHAEKFAPRGAFFIIKSEHFVGWKVFGTAGEAAESKVREIHFAASNDSILSAAAWSLNAVEAQAGAGDTAFLEPLEFGGPDRMYAIPLVARHRTVAVLYADHGDEGGDVNREALETLVSVAGLTVELLASMQAAKAENRQVTADFEDARHDGEEAAPAATRDTPAAPAPSLAELQPAPLFEDTPPAAETLFDETIRDIPSSFPTFSAEDKTADFAFSESVVFEGGFPRDLVPPETFEAPPAEEAFADEDRVDGTPAGQPAADYYAPEPREPEETSFDTATTDPDLFPAPETTDGAIRFDSGGSIEAAAFESSPFGAPADVYEPATAISGTGFSPVAEAPVQPAPRLRDRPVDLPIEVPDDERRIHNDARRFARLLVSEIKLYNEKKVIEGREAGDLYERLREAIDRSREMYDKRVQPPVAAKFDYFNYEVVNALAEGNADRLGANYPGSVV